jgi:anti-sigma B factor antagonist
MLNSTKFEIEQSQNRGINCLYLHGYLDAHTAPELETRISDLIKEGNNRILVVLRDLEYISSAGLGVFMAFIEEIRENGGDIKLADMKPKVFSVFDLLGFPMLFDIDKKEELALNRFFIDGEKIHKND